jgi:phosphomannomutase
MPRGEHLLKIGVSGIRGVVGDFLTPQLACAFAQAFGTYVGSGRVVVGRDTRKSGEMLQHAVACGLLASGCDVVDVGILPTPTIQVYVDASRAWGGVAITASHNPPEYNALKLFNSRGLFFNNYERGELLDLYHQSNFRQAVNREIRRVRVDTASAPKIHIDRVLKYVDADRIRQRRFRVALDAVNGAGSLMSSGFLRDTMNCELHAISVDPDQPFPREAEPRPDTLTELAELVRHNGCDVGFGQDPDGDRLAVVDETGRVMDNDDVLALAVDAALRRLPGDVVVNLTTSSAIDDLARAYGRRVFRTPVGEANVVETIEAVKAVIGGEGSNGGIIFPAVPLCRATTAASARSNTSTVGWIHVRSSNTEPLLRMAAEAKSNQRVDDLFGRVMEIFRSC